MFFGPILDYGRETLGPARTDAIVREVGLDPTTLEDPSAWVSARATEALCEALVEASGDPRFLERASRRLLFGGYAGPFKGLLQALGSPRMVFERLPALGARWNKVGSLSVESASNAEVTLVYDGSTERSVHLCRGRLAQLGAIPVLFGHPPAAVEHPDCIHEGAPTCRYVIRWEPHRTAWLTHLGLAGAGALGVGVLAVVLGMSGLESTVVGALGGMLGAGVATLLEVNGRLTDRGRRLLEQAEALEWTLRRHEARYEELLDAKHAVDEQVETRTQELRRTSQQLAVALDRAESSLDQARHAQAEAERAVQVKSDFLASMSHELRTPLTAILGFAEALQEPQPEDVPGFAHTIHRSGAHLLQLINDILDFTSLDVADLALEAKPFDPWRVVLDVQELLVHRAAEHGTDLQVEHGACAPERLQGDALRVKQILVNLVGNAVKFTQDGEVRVSLSETAEGVRFEVRDTGVGIAEESLTAIFEAFVQVGDHAHRRAGTGLGLALARGLAERMAGTLTATSILGEGSSFVLTLPAPSADTPRRTRAPGATIERRTPKPTEPRTAARILLAEDGPDNRRLLKLILESAGCTVASVADGQAAIEYALANTPDLILMDVSMPILDGDEATRILRERGYRGPIVALTAHAMPEVRERCLAAGADGYLTKPIQRHELLDAVQSYAARSPTHA